MEPPPPGPRRRRRAVGPSGAHRGDAGLGDLLGAGPGGAEDAPPEPGEDERLRADRPPHHDRGV